MKRISIYFFIGALCITFGSCTKTGPEGPEGAQGEQGNPGMKGDSGPRGNPGQTGTAEIISSKWVNVNFTKQGDEWLGVINDPDITKMYMDSADANVFIKLKRNDNIYALNYFKVNDFYVTQEVKVGEINVHSSFDASVDSFRYVLIPAGAPAVARKAKSSTIDYDMIGDYFKLSR